MARFSILALLAAGVRDTRAVFSRGAVGVTAILAIFLLSVLLQEVIPNFGFKLGIAFMDGAAQSALDRRAFAQSLQDSGQIAHTVIGANALHRRQRFRIGDSGFLGVVAQK